MHARTDAIYRVNETGDVDPSTVHSWVGSPPTRNPATRGAFIWPGSAGSATASHGHDHGRHPVDRVRLDVTTIELLDSDATPTPRPDGEYVLDCGSLGPDTCATQAKAILDAQRVDHPSVQPVSIVFLDECGSYVARFDDGSGTSLAIDCVCP
jgi:hypothetical protein